MNNTGGIKNNEKRDIFVTKLDSFLPSAKLKQNNPQNKKTIGGRINKNKGKNKEENAKTEDERNLNNPKTTIEAIMSNIKQKILAIQ